MYIKYLFYWLFVQILLVHGQEKSIRCVIHLVKSSPDVDRIAINNAEDYLRVLEEVHEDIIIFPKFGLTTTLVVDSPVNRLYNHAIILPNDTAKSVCKKAQNGRDNNNQKALRKIACGAEKHKKHIIFHILETDSNFQYYYSTIVHIDKNGKIQNLYREAIADEEWSSIKTFEGHQTDMFDIDGAHYEIICGYNFINNWEKHDINWRKSEANIIYFSPIRHRMPFFNDESLLLSLSKEYNLNVYSPTLVGCTYKPYCGRSKTISIEKGRNNGKYSSSFAKHAYEHTYFTEFDKNIKNISQYTKAEIINNKAKTSDCSIDIISDNPKVQEQYWFISYSGPLNFNGETINLTICALTLINALTLNSNVSTYESFPEFKQIDILSVHKGPSMASTLNVDLWPVEYKLRTFGDNVLIEGSNLTDVITFGIIILSSAQSPDQVGSHFGKDRKKTKQKIHPVIYDINTNEQWISLDVVKNNALAYIDIMQETNADILIYPEFGLTTIDIISNEQDNLRDYTIILYEIGRDICKIDDEFNYNQMALKLLGCAAKQYKKHLVFHVLEYQDPLYYSTIVYIDNKGVMQNLHRMEVINENWNSRKVCKENSTVFQINGIYYEIIKSYDFLINWKEYNSNIIYYPPLSFHMPFLFDESLMLSISKQYSVNVYSPTLIGCNWNQYQYCSRGKSILIEDGINKGKYVNAFIQTDTELNIILNMKTYMKTIKFDDINKNETEHCLINFERNNDISRYYGLVSRSDEINVNNETLNITICAIVKRNIMDDNLNMSFGPITIKMKSNGRAVATTMSSAFTPIDHKLRKREITTLNGELKNFITFGILSEPISQDRGLNNHVNNFGAVYNSSWLFIYSIVFILYHNNYVYIY